MLHVCFAFTWVPTHLPVLHLLRAAKLVEALLQSVWAFPFEVHHLLIPSVVTTLLLMFCHRIRQPFCLLLVILVYPEVTAVENTPFICNTFMNSKQSHTLGFTDIFKLKGWPNTVEAYSSFCSLQQHKCSNFVLCLPLLLLLKLLKLHSLNRPSC